MSLLTQLLPKKETREYFLALGVEEHHIRAIIAQISGSELTVIGKGEAEYTEGKNETEAADIAISEAEKNLPDSTLVEKVVFSLPSYFLEDDKVKPDYLETLKKIAKDLNLKPCGFIEYSSAISYFLEREEGSPATLLLIYVGQKKLVVSLIRVGRVQQSITVERGASVGADLETSIKKFQAEILPSRIVLYDESDDLENVREDLLRMSWHKHASFLHTPKVEILPSEKIFEALVQAAGCSFTKDYQIQRKQLGIEEETSGTVEAERQRNMTEHAKPKHYETTHTVHHTETKEPPKNDIINEETFGFVRGDKAIEEIKKAKKDNIIIPENDISAPLKDEGINIDKPTKINLPGIKIPQIPSLPISLPKLSIIIVPVILLILAGITGYFLYWTYPKTTVNIITYALTQNLEKEVIFTKDAKKVETGKNFIMINTTSEDVSGTKTVSTTGKSQIGDKATGEVTLYNKTLSTKTFPKGSILKHSDLQFTLKEDVTIASASDTGEGLAYGKANVNVDAASIGPEGNLVADSSFYFKDFPDSSYSAKNNNAFVGGTSREIPSVSKEDQNNLEESLTEELVTKAKQQINQRVNAGEILLDSLSDISISSKKFSQTVGAEAKELTLDLTIKLNGYSFRQLDLLSLSIQNISSPPEGYTTDEKRTSVHISESKSDKTGDIKASASITTYLTPNMDKNIIVNQIAGKKYSLVSSYLKTVENVAGFKITKNKVLPFIGNNLPANRQNITLNVLTY